MEILKIIIIVLLSLASLLLLLALFLPKNYTISSSVIINKNKKEVFDYVKIIKNQENYSVWVMEDPNSKKEYKGVDGTIGFVSAWTSENKNVGEGEQEITGLIDGEKIDIDLRFKKPFEGNQKAANIFKEISNDSTEITTEFYGYNEYPTNLMVFFIKKILKKAMDQNMQNLKNILEK
jgi:hypothetical protein